MSTTTLYFGRHIGQDSITGLTANIGGQAHSDDEQYISNKKFTGFDFDNCSIPCNSLDNVICAAHTENVTEVEYILAITYNTDDHKNKGVLLRYTCLQNCPLTFLYTKIMKG